MSGRIFGERYYLRGDPDAEAQRAADEVERSKAIRELVANGPGRLTADEVMVLAWYREARDRHASDTFDAPTQVSVLLVGNPGAVGVVNHQLDHIGGGLTSVMDGVDVAHCHLPEFYAETKGMETPRPLVSVSAVANMLGAHEIFPSGDGMVSKHRGLAALEGKA